MLSASFRCSTRPVPLFHQITHTLHPARVARRAPGQAGGMALAVVFGVSGRLPRLRPRVPGICQPGATRPSEVLPRPPQRSWVWGSSLLPRGHSRGGVTTVIVYREALHSLTVLTGRSAGGLGRSLERPCKWSAALSEV